MKYNKRYIAMLIIHLKLHNAIKTNKNLSTGPMADTIFKNY